MDDVTLRTLRPGDSAGFPAGNTNTVTGKSSNDTPDLNKTIVAPNGDGIHGNISLSMRDGTNQTDGGIVDGVDFLLKGKVYHSEKCLSDNTGEAQVFLVKRDDKEYVLKVYYPNFTMKKRLMKIISNFEFEMIVKTYDFGKTYVDGKNRDYELMEYLRGGSFDNYCVNGDYNKFCRIALQAAAALAYCHNNSIIHKDIKPGNFFFRDEKKTQVVLGDFGISSILEADESLHRTTQARTPVYAAPEMYNDVIDGEVEITPSVDYYSLGITLMTIWLGDNPLKSNERIMMRRKSEGRLPGINELPDRVRMIVMGLTAVNPQKRWGYEEVERWFLGENVEVDISSPILKYKSFIVDPERNLVADNVHELIPLLVNNERIAVGYLYTGRITNWLDACGNTKLSMAVKEIVTNRYPIDQHAGLMASVYAMEPTYPYKDLHGNKCDDVHSMVISMLTYVDEYIIALQNPNDRFWLYAESHSDCDISRLRSYFTLEANLEGRKAILRTAYELDADIPFSTKYPTATIEEIVKMFGTQKLDEDTWESITDGRLLSWMYSHEGKMACESVRIMTEGQPYSKQLAYKVLYNVDRECAYDLNNANTPQQIGELMAEQLRRWQSLSDAAFAEAVSEYADPNGQFCYYAQVHGWMEQLANANRCFDLRSEENRDRLGAYDLRTAAYRFCRILGAKPTYLLKNKQTLKSPDEIQPAMNSELRTEMRTGSFAQWLAVFYHENPEEDFAADFSYERKLEQWLLKLGEIDMQQPFYKRFENAKKETAQKVAEVRNIYTSAKAKERTWFALFYSLVAVWLGLLVYAGVGDKAVFRENLFWTVGVPVGGVSAIILAVREFMKGYGFVLSCLFGGIGAATSIVAILLIKYVMGSHPGMLVPLIVLLTLVYTAVCYFTDYNRGSEHKADKKLFAEVMDSDDVKSALLEPLYYTFRQKSYHFKGSKFGVLDDVKNQMRSASGESIVHYVLWSLMALLLIGELVLYSPSYMNKPNPTFIKQPVDDDNDDVLDTPIVGATNDAANGIELENN